MKRYQECSLPVRIWRRRYYLPIPFLTIYWYFTTPHPLNWCWSIAIGNAQVKMRWVYTLDEVKDMRRSRRASRRAVIWALLFCVSASLALALFYVYGIGFRQGGTKFMLLYVGIFIGAPVACILATFGVYFVALVFNSKSRMQAELKDDLND